MSQNRTSTISITHKRRNVNNIISIQGTLVITASMSVRIRSIGKLLLIINKND